MLYASRYGTHLPIIYKLISLFPMDYIFEFGPGYYSTKFFEMNSKRFTSIESVDEKWYKEINTCIDKNKTELLFLPIDDAIALFNKKSNEISMLFVDGGSTHRIKCIESAFGKVSLIVVHDTETEGINGDIYNWHTISKKDGYYWMNIDRYLPWTVIISNNENIINKMSKEFSHRMKWK